MNRQEKERASQICIVDSIIIVVFLVIIAVLVKGFGTINPGSAISVSLILGQVLLYIGLVTCFIGYVKKKQLVLRYSIESVIWGALLLFLYYSFFRQKIMPNFGYIYYYSLLMLGVLYIIVSHVYTAIKIRK